MVYIICFQYYLKKFINQTNQSFTFDNQHIILIKNIFLKINKNLTYLLLKLINKMCMINRLTSLSQQLKKQNPAKNSILEHLYLNQLLTNDEESIRKKIVELMVQATQSSQFDINVQYDQKVQQQQEEVFQDKFKLQLQNINNYSVSLKGSIFMEIARYRLEISVKLYEKIALGYTSINMVGNIDQQKQFLQQILQNQFKIAYAFADRNSYFENQQDKQYSISGHIQVYSIQQASHLMIWFRNKQNLTQINGFIIPISEIPQQCIQSVEDDLISNQIIIYNIQFSNFIIHKEYKLYFLETERDYFDYIFKQSFLLFSWLFMGHILNYYEKIDSLLENQADKQNLNQIK
ncbi:hypothetical protein TTHERM_00527420 (macronuclear) [Tetrahymena thermophila SB210]|uniref:Uncharacterized protein n=1 Tax=Tetrahymena thermophila (strain SB210) TaxID=312017 RepID=I7M4R4_TETTS|nr:hypothetical protein TTHERM_00527420 [Tetrahymena thermophila SB210]EAS07905.2 hypothetical protein TTHERM_00527420 [Tetrahymena thermophila SB210]|eukprot:XP_001028147.2 hypothetical protein TTHERM_00527420 [Tetrahymena thermophila SB210]